MLLFFSLLCYIVRSSVLRVGWLALFLSEFVPARSSLFFLIIERFILFLSILYIHLLSVVCWIVVGPFRLSDFSVSSVPRFCYFGLRLLAARNNSTNMTMRLLLRLFVLVCLG